MTKAEKNRIIKWAKFVTDEELEKEYYNCIFKSLGSQTDRMYELGYDLADIKERAQYENFLRQKSILLEDLCKERNIELWKNWQHAN